MTANNRLHRDVGISRMKTECRILLAVVLASTATGCLGPVAGVYPPRLREQTETVFVVNHGWHTGIVVPTASLPDSAKPLWAGAERGRYLEFGWGDDGFYRADKVTSGTALRAMFWRNPAVLHVVSLDEPPEEYFPYSGVIRINVTTNGFQRLCSYLEQSYKRDEEHNPIDLGKGIYGESRFFRATGHYYFPNTCNKWTARGLRATGAPISPFYSVRAANVFRQSRKFGIVDRELSD